MASLWKHPNSPYWTACYTNMVGRRVKRSTKLRDKREAMRMANELESLEADARNKRLTVIQLQKITSDLCRRMTGDSLDIPTVEAFLRDWLDAKKNKGTSVSTGKRYGFTIEFFLDALGDMRHSQITSITPKHIEQFLNQRLKSGCAPNTALLDIKVLRTAFNRAERFGLILKNPVVAVDLPEADSMEREVFTHEEVGKLVKRL